MLLTSKPAVKKLEPAAGRADRRNPEAAGRARPNKPSVAQVAFE